jgi:hypothetical protein
MAASSLTPVLTELELAPSLVVFSLGGDGLKTGFGANCVVSAGREAAVVVDPLVAPARGDPALRGLFDDAVHRATDVEIDGPLELDLGGRVVEVRGRPHDCAD